MTTLDFVASSVFVICGAIMVSLQFLFRHPSKGMNILETAVGVLAIISLTCIASFRAIPYAYLCITA